MARPKIFVELKIKALKKAIENIGKNNMQRIFVAANDEGIGSALSSGDYIDLSEEPAGIECVKVALELMLEAEEKLLLTYKV